jgi:hypothetical protein
MRILYAVALAMFVFVLVAALEASGTFLNESGAVWVACGFIALCLAWLIGSWLDANFVIPRRRPPAGTPPAA